MLPKISIFLLAVLGVVSAQSPTVTPVVETPPDSDVILGWPTDSGKFYDLETSQDLIRWLPAGGFPKAGSGSLMQEIRPRATSEYFRIAARTTARAFFAPEVRSYQQATGITDQAAGEIDQFLRLLRSAGVNPALLWIGGSRYGSVSGTTARAVIGGDGAITGTLGTRGERYETFSATQTIRFVNPLQTASQKRVGIFVGATAANSTSAGEMISGGTQVNPRGPTLSNAWGGGNFQVYSDAGLALNTPGFGGFATPGAFLPYIGAAYDGYYSVLCGIGKSVGSREHPLRYFGMSQDRFPGNEFANDQQHVALGGLDFSGALHFVVVTADDLTENQRAYELVSIPKRCGFGSYGVQSAVVFLGDSITQGYHEHVWLSSRLTPAHQAGGQWNLKALGLLGNGSGEANDAQIEYFEKGSKHALDPRTWDHLFYVCGSGGHYLNSSHVSQNPLSREALDTVEAWVREYHEKIAIPASETGATVIQMTYIYGCPDKFSPAIDPEIYRTFTDHFAATQRAYASAAGFPIFDAYMIPQLNTPLAAFYNDNIHPNNAGNRLLAQEFAATVANPGSRIPRSLSRPVISGTAKKGINLTASKGSWAFTPTTYRYQWMREATDIPGATAASYNLQTGDVGSHISCRVTASNTDGGAERTTAHTLAVAP